LKDLAVQFETILSGGDFRSLGHSQKIFSRIKDQQSFDVLFNFLYNDDRTIVLRAVDTIEKIARNNSEYLQKNKSKILKLTIKTKAPELKWHLSLMIPRLRLTSTETGRFWQILTSWLLDKNEGRIVRVNAMQGLYELLLNNFELLNDFIHSVNQAMQEQIPSLNARARILQTKSKRSGLLINF
jgi:hypothetical protein